MQQCIIQLISLVLSLTQIMRHIIYNTSGAQSFTHFIHACQQKAQNDFRNPYSHNSADTFVPFHEQLLPHWREFARTVREDLSESTDDVLSISNVQLPKCVLDIVCPAIIASPDLHKLELEHARLDGAGFAAVAGILRHQPHLCDLGLTGNEILSVEDARALSGAIAEAPLRTLCLPHCGLGKHVGVLGAILEGCKEVLMLDLRHNAIDSRGVNALAKFIADNHRVCQMDLEGNLLSDEDVPPIVAALKKNTNLQTFDITENEPLTYDGRTEMMKAVFDTTSLNDVVGSNHYCSLVLTQERRPNQFFGMFFFLGGLGVGRERMPFERDMSDVNGTHHLKAKIKYKVSLALKGGSDEDALLNMGYLRDVPIKCFPQVLEIVQMRIDIGVNMYGLGHSEAVVTRGYPGAVGTRMELSRIFDALRSFPDLFAWKHPSATRKPTGKATGKRKRGTRNSKGDER